MALTIEVRGFRGIERADIEIDGIALVSGRNHMGKSSICLAAAAATTGQPIFPGMTKGQMTAYVRAGDLEGYAVFDDGRDNRSTVRYPKAERDTLGKPPEISPVAAGLVCPTEGDAKTRTRLLSPYLRAVPDIGDLKKAMEDASIFNEDILKSVWDHITSKGWDEAHAKARDTGIRLKGRWEQITGQRYGSDKAKRWFPENWVEDTTEERLTIAVADVKEALENAIARGAVDHVKIERLREEAAGLDDIESLIAEKTEEIETLEGELTEARVIRKALPDPDAKAVACPHCGEDVIVVHDLAGYELEKSGEKRVPKKELKKVREKIASADGAVRKIDGELGSARTALEEAKRSRASAVEAVAALENDGGGSEEETAKPADLEAARNIVTIAEAQLAAFKAKVEADQVDRSLGVNQSLVGILATDGLRRVVLMRELGKFNKAHLAPLWKAADWAPTVLTADFDLAYGSRPYALLSDSERWQAKAVLQIALALIEKAPLVILDGADILDQSGRNGLVRLLREAGIHALVAMTINKPELVPNLASAGYGTSYWVEDGIARPLDEALKEAA